MTGAAVKDALRSFLRVWIVGTVTLFLPGLFGWINEVTSWARAEGSTPFPDAHGLVFLFVAAITAAFPAAGAAILRLVENSTGTRLLPRPSGPLPPTKPRRGEQGEAVPLPVLWLVVVAYVGVVAVAVAVQLL